MIKVKNNKFLSTYYRVIYKTIEPNSLDILAKIKH